MVSRRSAVVETEECLADVNGVLSEAEHDSLILYVAQHPEAGVLIPETGGLRKLRWASKGKGKRGGSRVIYYFHNIDFPLFLMTIYAKNVQTDVDGAADGPRCATSRAEARLEGEENEMRQPSRRKVAKESPVGVKLLRSAQQARDWVNGKPGRVRVTYVPVPQVDVRKLRSNMGLSQTQFAARFGFSLDSIQNWEQGHRRPEGPARILLAVIAKNPKAVQQ